MEHAAKDQASTVNKAIHIVNILAQQPEGMGINAICRLVDTQKPGVLRIMRALVDAGWVLKEPQTGHYRLGYRLLTLATQALLGDRFQEVAHAGLRRLAMETGGTANLGVMDRTHVVFIDQVESQQPFLLMVRVGSRAPVHCTALGTVLAAYSAPTVQLAILSEAPFQAFTAKTIITAQGLKRELEEVARAGFALDREEHREGVACVAAAVRNYWGDVVAAISISGAAKDLLSPGATEDYVRMVRVTAEEISAQLGYQPQQPFGYALVPADDAGKSPDPVDNRPQKAKTRSAVERLH